MTSLKKAGLFQDFLAVIAGALIPLSLSPVDFWPAALVAPALLFAITASCSEHRLMLRFYLFNVSMFAAGVSWIYVSIHVYGGASPVLAGILVALFVLAYSLVCLPQAFVYARWFRRSHGLMMLAFCGFWVIQEWFRSWFLTGFPWLFLGYGVIDSPLRVYAAVMGVFGLSLVVTLLSVSVWLTLTRRSLWLSIPAVLVLTGALVLQPMTFTQSSGTVTVSLIQGNIDQHVKWLPASRLPILNHYLEATQDEWGRDLIIWPEAAVTFFHDNSTGLLEQLSDRAEQNASTLVLGIPDRNAGGGFQNTVVALGAGSGQYIKRRLVPFGEYVPLEGLLRGVITFFDLPMSRNESGPRLQTPLTAAGLTLSTSICYEVVYPELVRRTAENPDLLVTVSNDTWFGSSIGPWQHLQMARMRALENGRSMARSTNNGVTALIDHRGELISRLPQFETAVLRGDLDIRTGTTPFQRFGSYPVLLLSLILVIVTLVHRLIRR